MKNIIFLILDEFADWETAFLSSALNDKNITPSYSIKFASIDMEIKTSMGNLKVLPNLILDKINENTDVMRALGDIPEKNIDFFFNIYTIGFIEAMKKYSSK